MKRYAIILLAGILGGYVSDLNAVDFTNVGGNVESGRFAAFPGEEYPGMMTFVNTVLDLDKEGRGVYLVLGDKGYHDDEVRGGIRFCDKRWVFLDIDANAYDPGLRGRAVLKADVSDKVMWNILEEYISNTFLYIVDDFNLLATCYCSQSSLKERIDGIWHVLMPGGVLVTQLFGQKLKPDEARDICGKFNVYVTDDVFLSICCGSEAQPIYHSRGVDNYYQCVHYWIHHVDDDVKLNVLSAEDKEILRRVNGSVSGSIMDGSLLMATREVVDEADGIVRKMVPTWKVDTLLESLDGFEGKNAEFLAGYPENMAGTTEARQNVLQARYQHLWGTYLIFQKK
ncbi:MAG: hypothetical protein LBJ71_03110 [Holosporaceae bacterium]|jgi:hypothetical protein|nr:hypothetical protein [Holosporaceae bacterium]